jgi:hypothetical protein
MLVRSEYEAVERAILAANARHIDAFLLTGQPGIGPPPLTSSSAEPNVQSGKSVFLMWLLMRRLALRLPTALQVMENYAIFFHEGGTSQFSSLDSPIIYGGLRSPNNGPERIWALVDSNQSLLQPAPTFRGNGPFFVVEAVSPREEHFEWAKKVYSRHFYMKPWTSLEVLQASVTAPPDSSPTLMFSVVARSWGSESVALSKNTSSYTCTTLTGHPPERWPCMLASRARTMSLSSSKSRG